MNKIGLLLLSICTTSCGMERVEAQGDTDSILFRTGDNQIWRADSDFFEQAPVLHEWASDAHRPRTITVAAPLALLKHVFAIKILPDICAAEGYLEKFSPHELAEILDTYATLFCSDNWYEDIRFFNRACSPDPLFTAIAGFVLEKNIGAVGTALFTEHKFADQSMFEKRSRAAGRSRVGACDGEVPTISVLERFLRHCYHNEVVAQSPWTNKSLAQQRGPAPFACLRHISKDIVVGDSAATIGLPCADDIFVPLAGGQAAVNAISLSPDSQKLIMRLPDGTSNLVTVNGTLLAHLGCTGFVHEAAWNPLGTLFVTGARGTYAQLWRSDGSPAVKLGPHSGAIESVDWSGDGTMIAVGTIDGMVRVWRATAVSSQWLVQGVSTAGWNAHASGVCALSWHPKKHIVATGASDGWIKVWDTKGHLIAGFDAHAGCVCALFWFTIRDDEHALVIRLSGNAVRAALIKDGIFLLLPDCDTPLRDLAMVSPDGQLFAASSLAANDTWCQPLDQFQLTPLQQLYLVKAIRMSLSGSYGDQDDIHLHSFFWALPRPVQAIIRQIAPSLIPTRGERFVHGMRRLVTCLMCCRCPIEKA